MSGGILVISDLHAHAWPSHSSIGADGVNSRFADLLRVLDQVDVLIQEHRPDALCILGDLTHRRFFVTFSTYTPLAARLVRFRQFYNMLVIAMTGNHDLEARGHHSLGPLALAGIKVIDQPEWVDLPEYGPGFFVPYLPEGESVVSACRASADKALEAEHYEFPATAFLHYALDGKVLDTEYVLPSALSYDDVGFFKRIVFGHVHSPSVERDEQVIYVGAPLHFDFGDHGPRYAWLLTPDRVRRFPLSAPRFVSTTYPKVPACTDDLGGFLRVLSTPVNVAVDVKKLALDLGWTDAVTVEASLPDEAVRTLSASVFVDDAMLREHVESQYASLTQETRDAILAFGLDCLREAQQR